MSAIDIKIGVVNNQLPSLSSIRSKLAHIESQVKAIQNGLDGRIVSRRNINQQFNNAARAFNMTDARVQQLNKSIRKSTFLYENAERRLLLQATNISRSGSPLFLNGGLFQFGPRPSLINKNEVLFSPIYKESGIPNANQNARRWKGDGYLLGSTTKNSDNMKSSGGIGYYDYDWVGLDGAFEYNQLGGKGKFSGINTKIDIDTNILDSETNMDILAAEGKASIGGESIFPIASADAKVLGFNERLQLDDKIPLVGRTGVEGKGDILKAKAFAGIDDHTIGIGAKAAIAEAEGAFIVPILFTDVNIKLIAGVSAGGIGGEAKIGKETSLDLRAIIGVKLGLAFESESDDD